MAKDFDSWNEEKKRVGAGKPRFYTVRELWWCHLGLNVGTEQDGKDAWYARPCVILRGLGPNTCLAVPLTTSAREHPLRVPIGLVDGKEARANVSQMRVIDARRLKLKMGFLNKEAFAQIRKTARAML